MCTTTNSYLCLVQENFDENENAFPNCYPTLLSTYKDGYLYVERDKLYEYQLKEGNWESELRHDGPVSDLSVMGSVIFIIVSKTLLQCMEYETSFTPVPNGPPNVVQVASGELHSLVLTENGEVFSRGNGPQCGHGAENPSVQVFTQIPGLSHIISISAGAEHSAVLQYKKDNVLPVDDGVVRRLREMPMDRRHFSLSRVTVPCDISNPNTDFIRDLVNISRSEQDILDSMSSLAPIPQEDPIKNIEPLTKMESTVWVWGRNDAHQLGLSGSGERWLPETLPRLVDIAQIVCGAQHTVAMTAAGQLFVWGKFLNHKNCTEKTPVEVPGPELGNYVIAVAAGKNFTVAYGHNAANPSVFVIDKNKRLQKRAWITQKRLGERNYIQYIFCDRYQPQGQVVMISPLTPSAREALFKLNYRLVLFSDQYLKLWRAFRDVTHKIFIQEEMEKMANLMLTFWNFLDCITKMLDICTRLTQHLTTYTLRLPSLKTDTQLPEMLRHFADVNGYYCNLFADISSLDGLSLMAQSRTLNETLRGVATNLLPKTQKSSKKLTKEEVIKQLIDAFQEGLVLNYDELTDWKVLQEHGNRLLVEAIEDMKKRLDENVATIDDAATSAGIVKTFLNDVQEKFFVRDRRIKMISTQIKIDIMFKGESYIQRDAILVLCNKELIYVVNSKMTVINFQAVWLFNHNKTANTVDVFCPELFLTLKGQPKALDQWMTAIRDGISRKFEVSQSDASNECLPVRQFDFTFENGDTYSGQWKNAKMHGSGTLKHSGSKAAKSAPFTYTGDFRDGKKTGYGRMVIEWPDMVIEEQVGSWINDRLDGYVEVQRNRVANPQSPVPLTKFKGYYSRGKPNGLGRLEECEQNKPSFIYLGNFVNNQKEGFGISFEGDICYFGEFAEDLKLNKGFTINYLLGEIVETEAKDTRVKVISGPNYTYTASAGAVESHGVGTLCYKLDNYVINFCGRITRDNDDDAESWLISEGKLTIKRKQGNFADILYVTDLDNLVSPKWRSLVNDCSQMLVPEPYRKETGGVQQLWRVHLPSKLNQWLGANIDEADFDTFAKLASESCVTAEEFYKMQNFCSLVIKHCPHFPLTFFFELRREVFSYFVGVHHSEHLEEKVLKEFIALCQDTYCLLRLLFPVLPTKEVHFVDADSFLTGRDLVLGILSEDFYRMLTAIFNSITYDSAIAFRENNSKWKNDWRTFLEQSGHFSKVRHVIKQISASLEEYPDGSDNPEKLETLMDIVHFMRSTFSDVLCITASKAFELLKVLSKIYKAIEDFLCQSNDQQGADEVLPTAIFVLWYADPTNINLCISLIRHLAMHRVSDVGSQSYALHTFHGALMILEGKGGS